MNSVPQYNYAYISGTTVAQVATGAGVLHTIVVNSVPSGPVVVADANGTSGTLGVIATLTDTVTPQTLIYDCIFTNGLKITQQAGGNITVMTRKTF